MLSAILLCVFRKCCICTHLQTMPGAYMHVWLLCVYCKQNHLSYTHTHALTHTHTHTRTPLRPPHKRVWQLSAGLFIDVLPQREVDGWSEGAQVRKWKKERKQGQRRAVSWLDKWTTWFSPHHSHMQNLIDNWNQKWWMHRIFIICHFVRIKSSCTYYPCL